jgi:hypothetical protein
VVGRDGQKLNESSQTEIHDVAALIGEVLRGCVQIEVSIGMYRVYAANVLIALVRVCAICAATGDAGEEHALPRHLQ